MPVRRGSQGGQLKSRQLLALSGRHPGAHSKTESAGRKHVAGVLRILLVPQAAALLATVQLTCTAPQIEVVDELAWPAAYARTIEEHNVIWMKRFAAESDTAYRILVHEMIHCALYEQRERAGMRHPRSLDPREEMTVQALTE